jgi:hypothetical protein
MASKPPAGSSPATGLQPAPRSMSSLYWDLVSLLDLLLDGDDAGDIGPEDLRRFEDYAKTALSALR